MVVGPSPRHIFFPEAKKVAGETGGLSWLPALIHNLDMMAHFFWSLDTASRM